MSTETPTAVESTEPQLSDRDVRALVECQLVCGNVGRAAGADDLYVVVGQSGSEYLVDLRDETCECPDHHHREVECKHIRRAKYATGERPVPAWVEPAMVDDQLGEAVDASPRQAITDGGARAVDGDGAEVLDDVAEWRGPFPERDKYGNATGAGYYRCSGCGIEVHENIPRDDVTSHRDGCGMEA